MARFGTGLKPTEFQLQITRREFCQSTATVALAIAVLGVSALPPFAGQALAETVPAAELMKPDALPDMAMGDDKAPVTIIEYASMTCPHCAHFQETTFPELKKRYIDTGKVRFIFREFPLDSLAAAAFMLARCAGKDDKNKYFAMVDTLFRQQRQWAVEKPLPPLLAIAKQAGFTEQSFNACLANQKVLRRHRKRAPARRRQVQGAVDADLFINGKQVAGRHLDRGSGQGDRALSQGLIRVFRRRRGPAAWPANFAPAAAERSGKPRSLAAALLLKRARRFILRPMRHTLTSVRGQAPDRIAILSNARPSGTTGFDPSRMAT